MRRLNPAIVAFVGWTLFVWATRIGNIWRDDDLGTGAKLADTVLAGSFVVLALAVAWVVVRGGPATIRRTMRFAVAYTAAVWTIRGLDILTGDWSIGFEVVHTVLAVVSVALAFLAARSTRAWAAIPMDPSAPRGDAPMRTG